MFLSAHSRRVGFVLLKLALTGIVVFAIVWTVNFRAALQLLATISWATIAACLALHLICCWIGGVRLATVLLIFDSKLSTATATKFTLQSSFFNQAFISIIGGDAFKVWRVHSEGISLVHATSGVVLERILGITINHLTFVCFLPLIYRRIDNEFIRLGLLALAVGGMAGIVLLLVLGILGRRGMHRVILPVRWRAHRIPVLLAELATIGRHILAHPGLGIRIGVLTMLLALVNCLLFLLILRDWKVEPFVSWYCALLVPAVLEISLIPVSISGWGLREGAAVVLFGAVGLTSETSLAASAAFGLISLAVGLLGGLAWLADRSLRRLPRAPFKQD